MSRVVWRWLLPVVCFPRVSGDEPDGRERLRAVA